MPDNRRTEMLMKWQLQLAVVSALAFTGAGGFVACGNDSADCSSDADCSGDLVCSGGDCIGPWKTKRDVGRSGDGTNRGDDGGSTASPSDTENGADAAPDIVGDRPLSCSEFFQCRNVVCGEQGYQCRADYDRRLPEAEREERDQFEQCSETRCRGARGEEWEQCLYENCGKAWEQCYTEPDGREKLDCSEYRACLQACAAADDEPQCRADCQTRATAHAEKRLQAYLDCTRDHCSGTSGVEAADCIQKNCRTELDRCFGC